MPRSTTSSSGQWVQSYEGELHFPKNGKAGPPVQVVLLGTRVTTVEVPFAMDDVKLP